MTAEKEDASGAGRARRVQNLFEAAVDLVDVARADYLDGACAGDLELRREVEGLLGSLARAHTGQLLVPLVGGLVEAAPEQATFIGRRVHNYQVTSLIGAGGMGAIYLCEHLSFPRKAALKVLHAEHASAGDLVQRFLNEARAANAIRHPNIVEIVDAGRLAEDGSPYILMEFLAGENLAARISERGRFRAAEVVAVGQQIASALGAAHDKGIVHRDLKPQNIFVQKREDGTEVIKVLDFGIAKLRPDIAAVGTKTESGAFYGTPQYMAPEQCRSFRDVDHRSDVYALGVILYEMACGQPPFIASGFGDLLLMHLTNVPEPPRAKQPDIPAALERAILRALAKEPADRFASMAELAAGLGAGADASPRAGTAAKLAAFNATPPTAGATRMRRLPLLAGAVVLAAAAVAAFVAPRILRSTHAPALPPTPVAGPALDRPKAAPLVPVRNQETTGLSASPSAKVPPSPATKRKSRTDIPAALKVNPYR